LSKKFSPSLFAKIPWVSGIRHRNRQDVSHMLSNGWLFNIFSIERL
jgi:hypothetical protein